MRREFLAGLLAIAMPVVAYAQETFDEAAIYEAAKQEGELTWYIGQYVTETAEKIGQKFTETYPGVKVNVIRMSGGAAFSRLQQDFSAGITECDVFGATDLGHAIALKAEGKLQQFTTANDAKLYPQFQKMDPDGYYVQTAINAMIITYNTTLVSAEDAPKRWEDLQDPKWKDKLAFGHPAYAGTMGLWVAAMIELYGEEYFDEIAKNNPLIGRSTADSVNAVSLGERAVGAGSLTVVVNDIAAGKPMAYVVPEEGALASKFPTMIPANAPHPNAARLFINFVQSAALQEYLAELDYRTPVNAEARVIEGVPRTYEVKAMDVDETELSPKVPDGIEVFRDHFAG